MTWINERLEVTRTSLGRRVDRVDVVAYVEANDELIGVIPAGERPAYDTDHAVQLLTLDAFRFVGVIRVGCNGEVRPRMFGVGDLPGWHAVTFELPGYE